MADPVASPTPPTPPPAAPPLPAPATAPPAPSAMDNNMVDMLQRWQTNFAAQTNKFVSDMQQWSTGGAVAPPPTGAPPTGDLTDFSILAALNADPDLRKAVVALIGSKKSSAPVTT
jgi:hypothetical protein